MRRRFQIASREALVVAENLSTVFNTGEWHSDLAHRPGVASRRFASLRVASAPWSTRPELSCTDVTASQQLLDQTQSLARIAELEAFPRAYADRLASELGSEVTLAALEHQDDRLRGALAQIDAMTERVMRIRLDHALAADTSIPVPARRVFAATILGYTGRVELLETRARDVAARSGASSPDVASAQVAEAARATLALRDVLRFHVIALTRELAIAAAAAAQAHARDGHLDEPVLRKWSAMRRELEAIIDQPERILGSAMAERVARWPDQLDERGPEATFAEMIEID